MEREESVPPAGDASHHDRRIAAVVLAAGGSTRMGRTNKLLADVDGRPIIRRVVDALGPLRLADCVVVTGTDAGDVRAALAGLDVRFIHNADCAEGMGSSIRTGVAALPADVDGALIVLGDMPWLAARDMALLLDAFDPGAGRGICVPVHLGRRGNPVLWAARYFADLQRLTGDVGGRALVERFAHDVREVAVSGAGILMDIDTPGALRAAQARGPDGV
jgi:molybdenum cofactor cytidylyltransferase